MSESPTQPPPAPSPAAPSLSVIIPAYNYGRFLPRALDSALGQTLPAREVIVVDDGSTDDTPEVSARYEGRVRVIRQRNQGAAAARNAGAAAASGELLAFLDADDVWLPRKNERQVERFRAETGLGLVHCGVEEIDEAGALLRRRLDGMEGWVADELLLARRAVIQGGGSGAVIPRRVFAEVGGFDPSLPPAEDWELYYRIARRYKVGFVAEPLVQYRLHGRNSHLDLRLREQKVLRAYAKAFEESGPEALRLRRRAYGNLHMALAAHFYAGGLPLGALRHVVKGLLFDPRALTLPARWCYSGQLSSRLRAAGG